MTRDPGRNSPEGDEEAAPGTKHNVALELQTSPSHAVPWLCMHVCATTCFHSFIQVCLLYLSYAKL